MIDITGGEEDEGRSRRQIVLINPEVIAKEGKQTGEEGCLSIPGFREPVTRAKKVDGARAERERRVVRDYRRRSAGARLCSTRSII